MLDCFQFFYLCVEVYGVILLVNLQLPLEFLCFYQFIELYESAAVLFLSIPDELLDVFSFCFPCFELLCRGDDGPVLFDAPLRRLFLLLFDIEFSVFLSLLPGKKRFKWELHAGRYDGFPGCEVVSDIEGRYRGKGVLTFDDFCLYLCFLYIRGVVDSVLDDFFERLKVFKLTDIFDLFFMLFNFLDDKLCVFFLFNNGWV